jgi:hypothetical protein
VSGPTRSNGRGETVAALAYTATFLAGIGTVIYLNTTVWCLGDVKFGGGCSSWDLYFLLWTIFMLPAATIVFFLGRVRVHPLSHRITIWSFGLLAVFGWVLTTWRVEALDSQTGLILGAVVPPFVAWCLRLFLRDRSTLTAPRP